MKWTQWRTLIYFFGCKVDELAFSFSSFPRDVVRFSSGSFWKGDIDCWRYFCTAESWLLLISVWDTVWGITAEDSSVVAAFASCFTPSCFDGGGSFRTNRPFKRWSSFLLHVILFSCRPSIMEIHPQYPSCHKFTPCCIWDWTYWNKSVCLTCGVPSRGSFCMFISSSSTISATVWVIIWEAGLDYSPLQSEWLRGLQS